MNMHLINKANAVFESADHAKISSLVEWIQGNNADLDKVNSELKELTPEDEFTTEFEAVLTYQDAVLEMLGQLKARQCQFRQNHCSRNTQPLAARPSQTPEDHALRKAIKLPTLQVQTFDGKLCHRSSLWKQLRASVDENENLTKRENFYYVKTFLRGDITSAVSGLQASAKCYDDDDDI